MNENFEVTKQLIIEMLNDKRYNSDMSNDMNFTINWISEAFAMLKYEEDRKQLQAQLNNLQNNIEDYNNVNEEQKNRIIRECVKRVDIEKDGITSVGKYIEIYMIDGTKHSIHMSKKGNNFITKVIYKDEERPLDDLQITVRFIRKKY